SSAPQPTICCRPMPKDSRAAGSLTSALSEGRSTFVLGKELALSLPLRRTLFEKGPHAFLGIGGDGILEHRLLGYLVSSRAIQRELFVKGLLSQRHGGRAGVADLLRELHRLFGQPA